MAITRSNWGVVTGIASGDAYTGADISQSNGTLDAQLRALIAAQGVGVYSGFAVSAGSGLSVVISAGSGLANDSTYGPGVLKTASSVTLSGLTPSTTLTIFAKVDVRAGVNDSRLSNAPAFVASLSPTMAGAIRLATVTTNGSSVTGVTDGRSFLASSSGSGSGHVIQNSSGTALPQRANLQFVGATADDDALNNRTVISIPSGGEVSGTNGWSPVIAYVSDGARRVAQVSDWTGGSGTKPSTGSYVGATGLVDDLADAVDMRGPTGAVGAIGAAGSAATVTVGSVTTGAPGTSASVSNSGTTSAAVLDFTIPRGNTGAIGAHKATHATGGSDALSPDDIGAAAIDASNITDSVPEWLAALGLNSVAKTDEITTFGSNDFDGEKYQLSVNVGSARKVGFFTVNNGGEGGIKADSLLLLRYGGYTDIKDSLGKYIRFEPWGNLPTIGSNGDFRIGDDRFGFGFFKTHFANYLGLNVAFPQSPLHIANNDANNTAFILDLASGQTAPAFKIRDSSGNLLSYIGSTGRGVFSEIYATQLLTPKVVGKDPGADFYFASHRLGGTLGVSDAVYSRNGLHVGYDWRQVVDTAGNWIGNPISNLDAGSVLLMQMFG